MRIYRTRHENTARHTQSHPLLYNYHLVDMNTLILLVPLFFFTLDMPVILTSNNCYNTTLIWKWLTTCSSCTMKFVKKKQQQTNKQENIKNTHKKNKNKQNLIIIIIIVNVWIEPLVICKIITHWSSFFLPWTYLLFDRNDTTMKWKWQTWSYLGEHYNDCNTSLSWPDLSCSVLLFLIHLNRVHYSCIYRLLSVSV